MVECMIIKPDLDSRNLLVAVREYYDNNWNPKFLHLISKIVVSGDHLPIKVSVS